MLTHMKGTTVWDGSFNDMSSSADLTKWSFSNPVGAYQYYIHGPGSVDKYVNLDASFKNPTDTKSKQGVKITIDETAKWNGQTMLRTELIPQTTAAINKGKLYYHFSVQTSETNAPTTANEHQVAFFESHFTELKYGGAAGNNLQWHVGGLSKWETELVAGEWSNFAYEIDFSAGSVALWHSTGSSALTKAVASMTASTSSNGADWHLGVLRLPGNNDGPGAEDWYFSGVYIESGGLTTAIGDSDVGAEKPAASAAPVAASSAVAAASSAVASSAVAATSSTVVAVVETPTSSFVAIASSTPIAAVSSSTAAIIPTSAASSTPAAIGTPVVTPSSVASSAPVSTPTVPASSDATLPEEFTIKQFVAWLRAKQGLN
jgi:hypothetical protein